MERVRENLMFHHGELRACPAAGGRCKGTQLMTAITLVTEVDSLSVDVSRRTRRNTQMKKTIAITLEENDWWQIIDGLLCRAEQYDQTADYYEGGYAEGEVLMVRDSDEARYLAEWYRRLAKQLRDQMNASRR